MSCRARIFFPEFNIRLYVKNSESDYFFPSSTKIRIFFSAALGIRIFFLENSHNPPSFKLNGLSQNSFIFSDYDSLRDVRKKTTEWLILIKKKYEINSLHVYSCYDFICKEIFVVRLSEKSIQIYYIHSQFL